jgi:FkbM family methyltransferase
MAVSMETIIRTAKGLPAIFGIKKFGDLPVINRCLFYYRWSSYGNMMYYDANDKIITQSLLRYGSWEGTETRKFKSILRRDMTVLDLGANIGWYTLIACRKVGEKGKVFAFEPDPTNCFLLRKNVKINNYSNVVVEQKAVLDESRRVNLFLDQDNRGDHRIFDSSDGRSWITVDGVSLDDYFRDERKQIDVIKMDIQGAEMLALLGMDKLIRSNDELMIFLEFSPFLMERTGFSPEVFLSKLKSYGFKTSIVNDKKGKIDLADHEKILKPLISEARRTNKPLNYGIDLFLEK